jgi:hypothetical protein
MGLYWQRYAKLLKDNSGTWFSAYTDDGCLVDTSTVRQMMPQMFHVDGLVHWNFSECLEKLVAESIEWAALRGASTRRARIAKVNQQKLAIFGALGFTATGKVEHLPHNRVGNAERRYMAEVVDIERMDPVSWRVPNG